MREIKFRIRLSGTWYYWGFIKGKQDYNFAGIPSSNLDTITMEEAMNRSQQFTGLLDRTGKEIYEGDFLDCDGLALAVSVSEYHGYRFMWGLDNLTKANATYGKIIGNLYEHPELLG